MTTTPTLSLPVDFTPAPVRHPYGPDPDFDPIYSRLAESAGDCPCEIVRTAFDTLG